MLTFLFERSVIVLYVEVEFKIKIFDIFNTSNINLIYYLTFSVILQDKLYNLPTDFVHEHQMRNIFNHLSLTDLQTFFLLTYTHIYIHYAFPNRDRKALLHGTTICTHI